MALIDVESIWRGAHLDNLRTELCKYIRRDVICRTVSAINDDFQIVKLEA